MFYWESGSLRLLLQSNMKIIFLLTNKSKIEPVPYTYEEKLKHFLVQLWGNNNNCSLKMEKLLNKLNYRILINKI